MRCPLCLSNPCRCFIAEDVDYLLTKRQICPNCNGENVQHPAWKEYWEDPANRERPVTTEQDIAWFREHAWEDLPPEEIECYECGGRGYIETQVDLRDVLRELGILPLIRWTDRAQDELIRRMLERAREVAQPGNSSGD